MFQTPNATHGTKTAHASTTRAAPVALAPQERAKGTRRREASIGQVHPKPAAVKLTPQEKARTLAAYWKANPRPTREVILRGVRYKVSGIAFDDPLPRGSEAKPPQKPGARPSHKRAADASPEHRESLPEWMPRPWTPSERARAATRLFETTRKVAGVPRCATKAEHRKLMAEYRELMFMAAKAELDKYLAKHSDPTQTLMSEQEWVDLVGEGKSRIRYAHQSVARLVVKAENGDPFAWEASRRLAARMIEQGDPLPPELRGFAVGVLLGTITKPKRSRSDHVVVRDAAIRTAAHVLEFQHNFIPLTRNEASASDSICDAIGEALNKRGEGIGYAAVVKIVMSGYPRRRK